MPKYHGYDIKTVKDFSALERVLRYSSEFHEMRLDWKRKRKKSEEEEEDEEKPRWEEGKEREWGGRGGKEGILFEAKSSSQSRGHPHTNLWEGEEQYDALKTTMIWGQRRRWYDKGTMGSKVTMGTRWWFVTPPPDDIISKRRIIIWQRCHHDTFVFILSSSQCLMM